MKNCDELEMARAKLIAVLSGSVPSPFQPEAEPMLCNMVNVLSWVLGYDDGDVISQNLSEIDTCINTMGALAVSAGEA